MSDSSSSNVRYCSEGCKTRITKVTYDSHTICAKCRGQECSKDLTCTECVGWEEKKWKVLKSHLDKLDRDRKRKAAVRAESRAASLEPV